MIPENPYEPPQQEPESARDQPPRPTPLRVRIMRECMFAVAYLVVVVALPFAMLWGLSFF